MANPRTRTTIVKRDLLTKRQQGRKRTKKVEPDNLLMFDANELGLDRDRLAAILSTQEGQTCVGELLTRMTQDAVVKDAQEGADNQALEDMCVAQHARLRLKRSQGYGGWNDSTRCDARKLAQHAVATLYGDADLVDVGNYMAFLNATAGGTYALRTVLKDRDDALVEGHVKARQAAEAVRKGTEEALNVLKQRLEASEANLQRALGYIDRVEDAETPLERIEHQRCGRVEQTMAVPTRRGPRLREEYDFSRDQNGQTLRRVY